MQRLTRDEIGLLSFTFYTFCTWRVRVRVAFKLHPRLQRAASSPENPRQILIIIAFRCVKRPTLVYSSQKIPFYSIISVVSFQIYNLIHAFRFNEKYTNFVFLPLLSYVIYFYLLYYTTNFFDYIKTDKKRCLSFQTQ